MKCYKCGKESTEPPLSTPNKLCYAIPTQFNQANELIPCGFHEVFIVMDEKDRNDDWIEIPHPMCDVCYNSVTWMG